MTLFAAITKPVVFPELLSLTLKTREGKTELALTNYKWMKCQCANAVPPCLSAPSMPSS